MISAVDNNIGQKWITMDNNGQQRTTMDNNPRCYMHLWCRFYYCERLVLLAAILLLKLGNMNSMNFAVLTQFEIFWCPKPEFNFRSDSILPRACKIVNSVHLMLTQFRMRSFAAKIQLWGGFQLTCKIEILHSQSVHLELGRSKFGAKQHCLNKYFRTNRNLFTC